MTNKILLIVFLFLLAAFGASRFFSKKNERTFNPEIIRLDSLQVASIAIQSKDDDYRQFLLSRGVSGWMVSRDDKTMAAASEPVHALLAALSLVKGSYIAAKTEQKWPEYEIEEGKASHLIAYSGDKVLADCYIGKMAVNMEAQQISSFFRLKKSPEVYAVEGMAGMTLSRGFDSYRSKQLLDLDHYAVEKLSYEGDIAYEVERKNGEWLLDGKTPVDSNLVRTFLLNLKLLAGEEFVKDFDSSIGDKNLLKKLSLSGGNMAEPIIVRCWRDTSLAKPFVIQSNQFPDSYFASDSSRLFYRLFKPIAEW